MNNTIPAEIVSLRDYWRVAKSRLDEQAWAYFSGGAEQERGMKKNEQAFEQFEIMPRVLRDLSVGSTQVRIHHRTYAYPIFLAPVAWQRWAHPLGEQAVAQAAAAMRTPFMLSMQSTCSLEELRAAAPQAELWVQWYWHNDTRATESLWQRCVHHDVAAIVLTVDAPIQGMRYREQRAGQMRPAHLQTPLLAEFNSVSPPHAPAGHSPIFGTGWMQHAPNWQTIQQFIQACPMPVWLKGIVHPDDARLAVEVGAAGLIVSNHGGRQLDALPASLSALPAVAAAVQGRIPIILDGGVRSGSDVFIALALGAQAVAVGRPYIMALAVGGAPAVAHVLHLLRTELEIAMVLAGCAQIEHITRESIQQRSY
mgnify:CR=1 FL=1